MDSSFPSYVTDILPPCLLIFAIMLPKGMCALRVHCNEKDHSLLLNFKHTVTDRSHILSSWSHEQHCCEWVGVQCDNITGRVTELSLPCSPELSANTCEYDKVNCLAGELHLSSLQLEFLNYLDLSNHDFQAVTLNDCPHSCENINSSNLLYLDLSYNEDLHFDHLHWLSFFPSLEHVNLSGINLQGKVDWIQLPTLLRSIKELRFDSCQLRNINPFLQYVNLTSLEFIGLSDNSFSSLLPVWLFNLSDLTFIDLSYNNFQDQFPKGLLNLQKLQTLYLKHNKLFGSIPVWLGQLEHLQEVDVTENLFSGPIPSTLGNLTSLTHLHVSSNHLEGSLPESLGQLLNLGVLEFDDNHLTGHVCERNFANLSKLTVLSMGSPGLIFEFDSLWIPPFQLEQVDCWTNWKSLAIISLSNNNLAGTIPRSLSFLSNLTVLHLNKNNLLGELPLSLKNCQNLQDLDVGENKLSGYIPYWIGHNARVLRLRSNQFSGTIPPQICQLTTLIVLDFAENNIFGSIPPRLHNMKAMAFPRSSEPSSICITSQGVVYKIIDSAMLHIKGQEWFYEGNLRLMRSIDLSSNNLSGMIPPDLYSLFELLALNLSHNRFEGNIPKEIGNLKQLESLDLANNLLSGEIPQSIAQLSFLEVLDLSFNNFSGKIPLGTQLQGFAAQSYTGNPELCGVPLPKNCADQNDMKPVEENDNQENEFLPSFYMGLGVGFAIAFWGVCGAIFFNRNFRCTYFRFFYHIRDKLYVLMVLKMNRFR
ncbi:receptor-like protein EIX2 [Prosopis cineraria]|uniref:receptor-like protein EIX2 n=1 Tax=Prosopis cineraria TaxID=364024 RepID=UPI00240EDC90|nr:receptor-like protein EIX2 [Prosopis cineraria]